jgi:hypothetical protein
MLHILEHMKFHLLYQELKIKICAHVFVLVMYDWNLVQREKCDVVDIKVLKRLS